MHLPRRLLLAPPLALALATAVLAGDMYAAPSAVRPLSAPAVTPADLAEADASLLPALPDAADRSRVPLPARPVPAKAPAPAKVPPAAIKRAPAVTPHSPAAHAAAPPASVAVPVRRTAPAPVAKRAAPVRPPVTQPAPKPALKPAPKPAPAPAPAPAPVGRNDYPYRTASGSASDPWGFTERQCVSFVAWRLSQAGSPLNNGSQGWGDASHWDDTARSLGRSITSRPSYGTVAQWNAGESSPYYASGSSLPNGRFSASGAGHVAWVLAVYSDGSALVEQYNLFGNQAYSTMRVKAPRYLHLR